MNNSNRLSKRMNLFKNKPSPIKDIMNYGDPQYIQKFGINPDELISYAGGWRFVEGVGSGITWPFEGVGTSTTSTGTDNPNPYSIMEAWNEHFKDPEFEDIDLVIAGPAEALVSRHLVELAEYRKDCVAFISPPSSPAGTEYNDPTYSGSLGGYSGPSAIVNYRNNTLNASSSYAVMDSGWKYQ